MYSQKIRSVNLSLGVLADQVSSEAWETIRQARKNLSSLADQLEAFEQFTALPEQQAKETRHEQN